VGVNYRGDRERAEHVVSEIEQEGGSAVAVMADITDPAAPNELFGALESHYGTPVLATPASTVTT
jgi:3-oxoacyl-[acyl-carrier protein] reductase